MNFLKKLLKGLAWTAAVVIVLLAAAWIWLASTASTREKEADAAWSAAGFKSYGDLQKAWPGAPDNADAHELEKRALAIGFDLVPGGAKNIPDSAKPAGLPALTGADGKRLEVSAWVDSVLAAPPGDAAAFPPALAAWLDAHAGEFDELIAWYSAHDPAWGYKISLSSQIPNLSGVQGLSRGLEALAIRRLQKGDAAGAEAALDADWRLSESILRPPFMINSLISASIRRRILPLLRTLPAPAATWHDRLDPARLDASFRDSLAFEGQMLRAFGEEAKQNPQAASEAMGIRAPFSRLYGGLYMRHVGADMSRAMLGYAQATRTAGACAAPGEKSKLTGDPAADHMGRWFTRPILSIAVPNLGSYARRERRLALEMEMTRRVLEQRAAKQADAAHHWPAALANPESVACPGAKWNWSADAAGVALTLEPKPVWGEDLKGHPENYEFKAAP